MIVPGISSACLYPCPTEEAVGYLTDHGVNHIEIFFNSPSELQKSFTDALPLNGATVHAIHPFTSAIEPLFFFTTYERRFYDALELYKSYFCAAQNLNCHQMVLHGDKVEKHTIDDEAYFERVAKIREAARPYGVEVLQENLSIYRCRTPDFVRRMRAYLHDDIGFVFDLKQAVRSGADPMDMIDTMGPCLKHIHISDHDDGGHDCLIPGCGNFDYHPLLDKLAAISYDGAMLIEVYRHNYGRPEELLDGLAFLKNLIQE
ncbi:MAG TPA: sugar phosphate isomerase/epimerase [Ruminococcaceae bacterium]|nr:sugar phosphate isomerase/epimerase [Oscillospiraceae bacterium]